MISPQHLTAGCPHLQGADDPETVHYGAAKAMDRSKRRDRRPTLFLLTDSTSFVSGHSLVVNGGWTAW